MQKMDKASILAGADLSRPVNYFEKDIAGWAERLTQLMQQAKYDKGMTRVEVARQAHVTQSMPTKWAKGEREPGLATLGVLATILDSTPEYIITGNEISQEELALIDSFRELGGKEKTFFFDALEAAIAMGVIRGLKAKQRQPPG